MNIALNMHPSPNRENSGPTLIYEVELVFATFPLPQAKVVFDEIFAEPALNRSFRMSPIRFIFPTMPTLDIDAAIFTIPTGRMVPEDSASTMKAGRKGRARPISIPALAPTPSEPPAAPAQSVMGIGPMAYIVDEVKTKSAIRKQINFFNGSPFPGTSEDIDVLVLI